MDIELRVRELLARGDVRGAATEAIRKFGPDVVRYLKAVLRDEADAADAFSFFAETLWRDLPKFRWESSLRTWAFRLAVHAGTRVRSSAWRRRVRQFFSSEASALADEVRASSKYRVERQRLYFEKLRGALTQQEQSLLVLRMDQELSWAEIAEVLSKEGKPVGVDAVGKRFERIKQRITRMAKAEGAVQRA